MASTLYENVEDWHSNEERKDLLSSGEVDALQVKGDVEEYDRGFEGICPKQEPQDEITEIELHGVDGNTKENGHEYSYKNGNDIDEELDEDEVNDDEDAMNGSEGDNNDQDKEENVELLAKTTEEEATSSVPYYGKTLVAPEYMKFLSPEETSLAGEEAEKDSSQSTLLNEFKDQIKENRKEDQSTEETSVQTVENEEEALEEDDLSSSKEELDEVENDVEKSEDVRHSCPVEGVDQSEEDEEIVEEEKEEEEEWDDSSNGSKLTPLEEKGSPQLAQEDDNEDQSESEEPENDVEDIGIKEEDEKLVNGEDAGILKVEQTLEKGSEISPGLTKVDDENSDSDEEIDIEHEESAGRKHSSSLKVHVHSPTPDISEMDPASQSFDAGEDGNGGKDHVTNQQETMQEQYLNEIDEEEQQRNLFSKPVETNEIYQDEDDLGHEAVDGETYQEGDSEENGEGGDENEAESCESDQEAANVVKDETTATSTEAPLKEEYDVHFSLHGQENESDLTGRVKELGKMFDGGGPVFPSPGRNNSEGVDGSPISVRKYKAIFEQDQMSVQGARDPGRREELINPPRGIVKNLLGLFENPQGFEARKG